MDIAAEDLSALLARERIRDAIVRTARGEDRRDAALIEAAYWPDASVDYGVFAGDFAAYLAWAVPGAAATVNSQHVLGQTFIALDGASARAETQVISYRRVDIGVEERDTCIGGRCLDVFEARDGQWRIASRLMLYDWYQDWGASIDWRKGLMGLPLGGPHHVGRAVGDHSEAFFGKGG